MELPGEPLWVLPCNFFLLLGCWLSASSHVGPLGDLEMDVE